MESEKKEPKRQFIDDKGQKFFFNEEGSLVVESNKGIWVDGAQYVKMYGNFQCNAKTLGIIINKFKGCPVVVSETLKNTYSTMFEKCGFVGDFGCDFVESIAIVNPTEDDKKLVEKIERYEVRNENMNEQVKQLKEELNMHKEMSYKLQENIHKFNKLPWWKRMFKKVEV